jgi:S-methylmethionine-dependent homocysteine/selenocysteine methylase
LAWPTRAAELTALAVAIAQKAVREHAKSNGTLQLGLAHGQAFVAGCMSPLQDSYSTAEAFPREIYLAEHREMAKNLAAGGVDLLLIETISNIREAEAAAQAASETKLPFGVSFICKADGRLFSGESIADAVQAVEPHKPSFIGINCSAAPTLNKALSQLRAATKLPMSIYANPSHTEDYQHWGETEAADPQVYAALAADWLQHGAHLVGGCCGTTPEHIAAIHAELEPQ